MYAPETVARPDGVLMLDDEHALTLGITMWADAVPDPKISAQFRSMSMALAYYREAGDRVNENCVAARAEWEKRGLHRVLAARLHIALPTFDRKKLGACQVDDDNRELAVHLDRTNVHLLLGEDPALYDLLAVATRTDRGTWPAARDVGDAVPDGP